MASTRAIQHERQKSVCASFGASRRSLTIYQYLPYIFINITDMFLRPDVKCWRSIVESLEIVPQSHPAIAWIADSPTALNILVGGSSVAPAVTTPTVVTVAASTATATAAAMAAGIATASCL